MAELSIYDSCLPGRPCDGPPTGLRRKVSIYAALLRHREEVFMECADIMRRVEPLGIFLGSVKVRLFFTLTLIFSTAI